MKAHLYAFFALLIVSIAGCGPAFLVDTTLMNAHIAQFEGDSLYYIYGHVAIRDGKILSITPVVEGRNDIPSAHDTVDLQGAYI
ncbi:MAG: hypothetical protein EBZ31_01740, partial [Flavobacteriia bacterium]|nr:hypothetical protein [Flavobacteriia bacterium]